MLCTVKKTEHTVVSFPNNILFFKGVAPKVQHLFIISSLAYFILRTSIYCV